MPSTELSPKNPEFSFVTCVSNWQLYNKCVISSLNQIDASQDIFEKIPIDNTENRFSAAQALNLGLNRSKGKLIIFCHQDLLFPKDWIDNFFKQINIIESRDKYWGVTGPFGRCSNGSMSGNVTDFMGLHFSPPLPRKVQTLDELCLIIRKDSGLQFDEYMDGFHLYGADICLTAACQGMQSYAIDCFVEHRSKGNKDEKWRLQKEKFIKKWQPKHHAVGKKICTASGKIRLHPPIIRFIRRIRDIVL